MDAEYIHSVAAAIRKNGLKQSFGKWVEYEENEQDYYRVRNIPVAACALGQAGINMGATGVAVMSRLSAAKGEPIFCPSKAKRFNCGPEYLGGIVMHLNDDHHWKFSSIANWLDKVANNG